MNMQEFKQWKENQKKQNAEKWNETRTSEGEIRGFSQKEFNASMKDVKRKTSTTRRSHSRGNLWNHHNLPQVKADMQIWWK